MRSFQLVMLSLALICVGASPTTTRQSPPTLRAKAGAPPAIAEWLKSQPTLKRSERVAVTKKIDEQTQQVRKERDPAKQKTAREGIRELRKRMAMLDDPRYIALPTVTTPESGNFGYLSQVCGIEAKSDTRGLFFNMETMKPEPGQFQAVEVTQSEAIGAALGGNAMTDEDWRQIREGIIRKQGIPVTLGDGLKELARDKDAHLKIDFPVIFTQTADAKRVPISAVDRFDVADVVEVVHQDGLTEEPLVGGPVQ
jgi:hypothetical protein